MKNSLALHVEKPSHLTTVLFHVVELPVYLSKGTDSQLVSHNDNWKHSLRCNITT